MFLSKNAAACCHLSCKPSIAIETNWSTLQLEYPPLWAPAPSAVRSLNCTQLVFHWPYVPTSCLLWMSSSCPSHMEWEQCLLWHTVGTTVSSHLVPGVRMCCSHSHTPKAQRFTRRIAKALIEQEGKAHIMLFVFLVKVLLNKCPVPSPPSPFIWFFQS